MKVLILVLSAMRDPWRSMLEVGQETWDKEDHPQTQTLYYCGKSDQHSTDKIFYSPDLDEELERVSARTLQAFRRSLCFDWDFMARVHSSCYVHKGNLVNHCETLHRKNLIYGLMTEGETPFMWGGGHYIFSRDVIEKFVQHPDKWDLNVMEDMSLTGAARALDVPLNSKGRTATIHLADWTIEGKKLCLCYNASETFEFVDWHLIKQAHPQHFFRCKQDLHRDLDLEIMHKLKEHY